MAKDGEALIARIEKEIAGTVAGVFRSTDHGASWTAASSGLGDLFVRALVLDPSNAQVVYAGTGGGAIPAPRRASGAPRAAGVRHR